MKVLFFLLFISFSFEIFSQKQVDIENLIKLELGNENYSNLEKSNPGYLNLLRNYALKGFEVSTFQSNHKNAVVLDKIQMRKKDEFITIDEFLKRFNEGNTNPLQFSFVPNVTAQVYQLSDSGYYLYIPAQKNLL